MSEDALHDQLLAIVLRLPGAYEDRPWGSVHCKVAGKIFVGWGRHDGEMELGFRTDPVLQGMLVASDPRFRIAKYTGKYGGLDMRLGPKPNWAEVEQLIVGSYRLVAPKKLVRELDARVESPAPTPAPKKTATKKPAAKKAATKKPAAKRAPAPRKSAAR